MPAISIRHPIYPNPSHWLTGHKCAEVPKWMMLLMLSPDLAHPELPPLKGARSDCFRFFSNFWRFWYQKKAHIFLITPDEFYS